MNNQELLEALAACIDCLAAYRLEDELNKQKAKGMALQVAPVIIGPLNAEAATGFPWRWCRDTWKALGGRFVGHGRKQGIPAAAFLSALERGVLETPESMLGSASTAEDAAAIIRRQLGLKLKRRP